MQTYAHRGYTHIGAQPRWLPDFICWVIYFRILNCIKICISSFCEFSIRVVLAAYSWLSTSTFPMPIVVTVSLHFKLQPYTACSTLLPFSFWQVQILMQTHKFSGLWNPVTYTTTVTITTLQELPWSSCNRSGLTASLFLSRKVATCKCASHHQDDGCWSSLPGTSLDRHND